MAQRRERNNPSAVAPRQPVTGSVSRPDTSEDRMGSLAVPRLALGYNPYGPYDPFEYVPMTYEKAWKDLYRLYRQVWVAPRMARYKAYLALGSGEHEFRKGTRQASVAGAILAEWREVAA